MEYTKEELKNIKRYATACLTIKEMSLLLNINYGDLKKDFLNPNSKGLKCYNTALAELKLTLREKEIDFAKRGSPQALINANNYISDIKIKDD